MSRDWVKVHCCILRDPNINGLSPQHGWNWTRMLVLAGDNDDGGRIGTPSSVAYVLRVDEAQVVDTVAALGGRIVHRDGQLWVRDWHEWQAVSNRERVTAFRARSANASKHLVTSGNGPKQVVTGGNGPKEPTDRGEERRGEDNRKHRGGEKIEKPAGRKRGRPPVHVTHPELWRAVCGWLGVLDTPTALSKTTAANIRRLTGLYLVSGEGEEQVAADAAAWYAEDWRGQKGQAPSVVQATDWRASCRAGGRGRRAGRETEAADWRADAMSDDDLEWLEGAV